MIRSMTGHGCAEKNLNYGTISIEMRSVNSRYFDALIKTPDFLELYKNNFNKTLSKKLTRGRVTVFIKFEPASLESQTISLDAAETLFSDLNKLKNRLGLSEEVTLSHLLEIPDILQENDPEVDPQTMLSDVQNILSVAADNMDKMRLIEGENLATVIDDNLNKISENLADIKNKIEDRKQSYFEKYSKLIKELSEDINIDDDRLVQEVAFMTKKVDISEECDRIDSHVSQFKNYLKDNGAVGKKMNFLVQELNREMTTIGSKSESAEISQLIVNMKNDLEKIREQVQNIL